MKFIRIKNPKANSPSFKFINFENVSGFICEYNPLNNKLMIEIKLKDSQTIYIQSVGSNHCCKQINKDFESFKINLSNYFDLSYLQ